MKIFDTMKYFQTSLAHIASSVTSEERKRIKKIMLQFLLRQDYFGKVWLTLFNTICKRKHSRCFI